MIAWNGCEKLTNPNDDIIPVDKQDEAFFESLEPEGKSELGQSISYQIKLIKIKVK